MSRLQVIGDPVLHSLSPKIQGAMLRKLGLDIPYDAYVVRRGELPDYLRWAAENGITGFNATMPHKEDLIPFLDGIDDHAGRCGAVNTVCRRDGKWMGFNTDGQGCLAALEDGGMWPAKRVVVLGAGGAAKAVAPTLAGAGAKVWVCNRTVDKAEALCRDRDNMNPAAWAELESICADADLVVNCTNLGMAGCGQFENFDFLNGLPAHAGVFDLIYHPAETELLAHVKALGHPVSNGLPMLVHQAIYALEYFLNRPLDHAEMSRTVGEALK